MEYKSASKVEIHKTLWRFLKPSLWLFLKFTKMIISLKWIYPKKQKMNKLKLWNGKDQVHTFSTWFRRSGCLQGERADMVMFKQFLRITTELQVLSIHIVNDKNSPQKEKIWKHKYSVERLIQYFKVKSPAQIFVDGKNRKLFWT